jgi:hypothetical protein
MFRCLPVVYDEGLRSYKAIAFIESVTTVGYLKLGATPQRTVLYRQNSLRYLSKSLGGKIYG